MNARGMLGLAKLGIPAKLEKGRNIVSRMTADSRFANCIPALADVTIALDELEDAALAAQGAGPAQTSIMYDKEKVVDSMLTKLLNYVEIIADGDESIILAAGMEVRGKGSRQPFQFTVVNGNREGEAVLQSPVTPRASYIWQRCKDPLSIDGENKWEQIAVTTLATLVTIGLVSGVKYWFRVATVTAAGQGLWSDPISLVAQ